MWAYRRNKHLGEALNRAMLVDPWLLNEIDKENHIDILLLVIYKNGARWSMQGVFEAKISFEA